MKTILISGATGMIGRKLTEKLISLNYRVRILSRKHVPGSYVWRPSESYIDRKAFEGLDAIIHLAGSPVSKRWTSSYRKELYDSRVKTAGLLFATAKETKAEIKTFITASGSNYYGTKTTGKVFEESCPHSNDFLGNLCFELEQAANNFGSLGARTCAVRTSAVLSPDGGILKELVPLAKKHLLSPLGSGKQIIPWIHIDDMVNLYIYLLENENHSGAFNAAAPQIITNREFTLALAESLDKKIILPHVPGFIMKILLGEMSSVLLEGNAISSEKIQAAGFESRFSSLRSALEDLLK